MAIAYIMSRFPKLTETFVLDEILEMKAQNEDVRLFPLWKESAEVVHDRAVPLVAEADFLPTLSVQIVLDNFYWLYEAPSNYLSNIFDALWRNRGSLRYLLAAAAILPKVSSMARNMQAAGVTHIHAHFVSHPALAALLISRLTGIPWSFTAHGSDLHRCQQMLSEKIREARFAVAISEYNKAFMIKTVGADVENRINVVRCGVNVSDFQISPAGVGQESIIRIACIGTLHEVKGQAFLLRACAAMPLVNWECHLIGDGPDRMALYQLALDLGIEAKVIFHGQLKQHEVRAELSRMSIVCAPSVPTSDGRREGIPVALIEAAACGLPIVASKLSGIPELVEDLQTGLLIEPGNVSELAKALAHLAVSPEDRAKLGGAARSKVEEKHTLSQGVARLRALMMDAAA